MFAGLRSGGGGATMAFVLPIRRYCDPMGAYPYGAPVEAVDPMTVSAGKAGFITDRV